MTNDMDGLQRLGRKRNLSEQDMQVIGRRLPRNGPSGDERPKPQAFVRPGLNLTKKGIRNICIVFGILLILTVAGVIAGKALLSGERDRPGDAASGSASSSAPAAAPAVLEEGEFLYTGVLECDDAEEFRLSFVLSADLEIIHDISISVKGLEAEHSSYGTTTNFSVADMTSSYPGRLFIDFDDTNYDVEFGKNRFYDLRFEQDKAFVALEYMFSNSGFGSSQDIEIPIFAFGELTTGVAPAREPKREEAPVPAEEPAPPMGEPTIFNTEALMNWTIAFGPDGIYSFQPAAPMPRYYIVCVNPVMDPVTGRESDGGYDFNSKRHMPVSTDDVMRRSGNLIDGGLVLADGPDIATFALIIDFAYDHTRPFQFRDGSSVMQYHGTTRAELRNLVTGESIFTEGLVTYATYANESVQTSMLEAAKGKQFYARSRVIESSDFEDYWDFIEKW